VASSPHRDKEEKRGRWEIRWVLSIVIVLLVAGALWSATNGRREVPGGATPTAEEWPVDTRNDSSVQRESIPQVPGT
jgi:heme A synthase